MGEEHSIKNLVARTTSDPWNSILGRRPGSYQIPEVGCALMDIVDFAVFERRLEKAIVTGVIFEKWAEHMVHFVSKAPAVMSTVYSVGGMRSLAEEKLIQAKSRIGNCMDCRAHYLKRNGVFFIYNEKPKESHHAYSEAIVLFEELGNDFEKAKCLINRGVVRSIMKDFESGLRDLEHALALLDSSTGRYLVIGAINRAAILTKMGNQAAAREKVEEVQAQLMGIKNVERPKLVLRWITALLLENTGSDRDRKLAAQMLDRVEARMRTLDMKQEVRVLLADRARIARAPHTIERIARKALSIEINQGVRSYIEAVIKDASRENLMGWRNALDSYVPPFSETA